MWQLKKDTVPWLWSWRKGPQAKKCCCKPWEKQGNRFSSRAFRGSLAQPASCTPVNMILDLRVPELLENTWEPSSLWSFFTALSICYFIRFTFNYIQIVYLGLGPSLIWPMHTSPTWSSTLPCSSFDQFLCPASSFLPQDLCTHCFLCLEYSSSPALSSLYLPFLAIFELPSLSSVISQSHCFPL